MNEALQILIGGLLQGSVFAIVALGFSLVYRVTGVINLAQGAFCVLSALTMYSLEDAGWPVPLAALVAILATTAFGLVLGAGTFVRALARLPNSGVLMLTAALLTLIEGLALVIWGSEPFALPPFSGEMPADLFGLAVPTQGFWIAGTSVLIIIVLWALLNHTRLGRALRACAGNRVAARLVGIDVPRMTLLSFVLSALIGAIAGIMVAPITSLQFDSGRYFTIAGFIAVAIGGMGSFIGSILGGLLLGVTEQLAAGYVSSLFSNAVAIGLLIVTLLWRPSGLFAGKARRQDLREEQRVHRGIVRLRGPRARLFGAGLVAVLLILPLVLPDQGLLNSLVIVGILYLAVLGLDVLMGFAGQVSLGQAGFMAIGGYTAAILATRYGWAPLAGVVAGIALSLLAAAALSLATMRLRGLYLALATLAFGLLVDSLTVGLTDLTGGPSGLVGIPSLTIGGLAFDTPLALYYLVAGLIIVIVLLLSGGIHSAFGRALQAVRTDQTAAGALGVNVAGYKIAAFAISAALGSLAGSLYAFSFHFLSPEMVGSPRSIEMIAMLVVGGEGTLVGGLFGSALLTMLPTVFQPLALYKTMATGILLVLAFQYFPEGLFGAAAGWLARRWDDRRLGRSVPRQLATRNHMR